MNPDALTVHNNLEITLMLSRSRKAFTLLELIVVIVILGILAALAIPTFASVIKKSKISTAVAAAESVGRNAIAIAAFYPEASGVTSTDIRAAAAETGPATTLADTSDDKVTVDPDSDLTGGTVEVYVDDVTVVLTFTNTSVTGVGSI